MPRKDLSLAEKITLLDQIKGHLPESHRRLAKITGVPKSTIARLLHKEDELREEWSRVGNQGASVKRKREGKDPDVENALNQWFSTVSGQGVSVSGPMLKEKAEELAKKLGRDDFKATDGWLSRWKCRHYIKFKRVHKEKKNANVLSAEEWKLKKIPELLEKYCADDIYNACETDLFYHAISDGTLCFSHEKLSASNKAMDHITLLCCSNMSGTDKKKLLVIGKNAKPRCFKGLRIKVLPVEYHANMNACMTSEIFTTWLMKWDEELQQSSRKILLILDNCAAHPQYLDCLKSVQLEFLPANTTFLLQPLHMGIIKNFKMLYHRKLVTHIIDALEENVLTFTTAKEISSKVNLFQVLQFAADSWREISSKTIQNCFSHCCFKNSAMDMLESVESESEAISELQKIRNSEEFESIDNSIECHNDNEDGEDEIIRNILSTHQEEELEEGSDDDTFELEQVTLRNARKCIDQLRQYFMQEGNEGSPLSALDACADFVHSQSIKSAQ